MALRPIKGRPGKFLDTSSGKVLDISDYREDDKYDTVAIPAGTIVAGTEFVFYRDIQQKRAVDTNFSQTSRLSAGEEMIIDRVGLAFRLATGNILPTPSDIKRVVENSFYRVEINRLLLIEGPAIKFPTGYGLWGQTQETGQGIVSVGSPATAAAAKLIKTQLITASHEVQAYLTFFDRNWPGFAAAVPNQADRQPTIDNPLVVTGYLHGLIKSASTK